MNLTTPLLLSGEKGQLLFATQIVVACCAAGCNGPAPPHVTGDLVSRPDTAVAIAKAVAEETYGHESVAGQSPLAAVKEGNAWHVSGRLPSGTAGGVVEVWVAAKDGRVLRLIHSK
jgi:NTF2 fold immunity protein